MPFLFNLFAEAFHWIIETYLHWDRLLHYLNNFISVLEAFSATSERVWIDYEGYKDLTDCLDILCNDTKNSIGTVCSVLEIEIDTDTFETYLLINKLNWAITAI